jgi:hypothetical protein
VAQVPGEIADRLYGAAPETFVAERDKLVAEAREAGDRDRAAAIGKLRKPTVAAWLVNLLALRRPDLLAGLVELAGQLRAAQRELQGEQLRELSGQRRAAVDALVAQARALAVAERPELARTKLPLSDVEATLSAALADEDVADQVRSGRLVRSVEYTGFGEIPRPKLRLVTDGAPPTRQEREDPERAVAAARTALEEAGAELERAAAAEEDGVRDLAEADAALAEARRRREEAEEELSRRKLARKTAERAVTAARRRLGEAEGALEAE